MRGMIRALPPAPGYGAPRRTSWQMNLAMQMMPPEQIERFSAHGWRIVDPESASRDCRAYHDFIKNSAGEFTGRSFTCVMTLSGCSRAASPCRLV